MRIRLRTSVTVAERLQANNVPFVFLTGAPGDATAVAQFRNAPVIGKPFDSETLFSALKQAMSGRR